MDITAVGLMVNLISDLLRKRPPPPKTLMTALMILLTLFTVALSVVIIFVIEADSANADLEIQVKELQEKSTQLAKNLASLDLHLEALKSVPENSKIAAQIKDIRSDMQILRNWQSDLSSLTVLMESLVKDPSRGLSTIILKKDLEQIDSKFADQLEEMTTQIKWIDERSKLAQNISIAVLVTLVAGLITTLIVQIFIQPRQDRQILEELRQRLEELLQAPTKPTDSAEEQTPRSEAPKDNATDH